MEKIAVAILFTESVGQFCRLLVVVVVMVVKVGRGVCVGLVRLRHLRQLVHALHRLMMTTVCRTTIVVIVDIDAAAAAAVVVVGTLLEEKKKKFSKHSLSD